MSRFFDGLRARLSGYFVVRDTSAALASETRDFTFTAYLPHETASIEMVFRASSVRRMANGRAERLASRADLERSGGLPWLLTMTFYLGLGAAEHAAMEGKIADLAFALGGRLVTGQSADRPPHRRCAA